MHWFGWKRGFDAVDVVSVEVTVDDVVEEARCVVMFAPMSSPTVPSPSPLSFKSALLALPLLSPEPPLPPRSSIIVVVFAFLHVLTYLLLKKKKGGFKREKTG